MGEHPAHGPHSLEKGFGWEEGGIQGTAWSLGGNSFC